MSPLVLSNKGRVYQRSKSVNEDESNQLKIRIDESMVSISSAARHCLCNGTEPTRCQES